MRGLLSSGSVRSGFVATCALALFVTGSGRTLAQSKAPLFKFNNKTYTAADLPSASQQMLFDVENESYTKTKQIAEGALLDAYFDEEAKKKGKSRKEIEDAALATKDPSEAELKKFYEENKARIPYEFDKIKGEIKNFVSAQKKQEKRQKLIEDVKKSSGGQILLSEPEAPLVSIDTMTYPSKGKKDAKVVIVEFADYQCPHCRAAQPVMSKIVEQYKDKVKFVFMDFPINHSGISKVVAEGAQCAAEQDKFWEYHAMAFEKQSELSNDSPSKLAEALKLNKDAFKKCLDSGKGKPLVEKSLAEGTRVGVGGTPTIFINGRRIAGHNEDDLKKAIDKALKG